jgi:hypothetical protein
MDKNNHVVVNFLGRFEKLQDHFDDICLLLHHEPIELPKNNSSKHPYYKQIYDKEMIDIVADYCKNDIDFFKYEF